MAKRKLPMREFLVTCDLHLRGATVLVMGRDEKDAHAAFYGMDWVGGADMSCAEVSDWCLTEIEPNE